MSDTAVAADDAGTAQAGRISALRHQLAVATRMLVDLSILGYSGHLSARVGGPGAGAGEERLLIQPVDEPRSELAPDRVLVVGFDGSVVGGQGAPPNELAIHVEIYRARPDVGAVAHFHHDRTTMLTMVEDGAVVPVKNHASRWAGGVPVHRDPSHVASGEKGRALAATLGAANAVLLRAHGEVVVAEDVPSLFSDVVHFVENADALAHATALGTVVPLSREECDRFLATFRRDRHAAKLWRYHTSGAVERGVVPRAWVAGAAPEQGDGPTPVPGENDGSAP